MIPDGFVAFAWYTGGRSMNPRTANMGVRESVVHLAPVEQTAPSPSGRERLPYVAVCGRRCRARGAQVEFPDLVAQELAAGRRKACVRCFAATP